MFKPKHKITIVYKSGAKVHTRAKHFTAKRSGGELTSVAWDGITDNPLFIGVDNIAAIWEGHK